MYFKDYMERMCQEHDLHKVIQKSCVTVHLISPSQNSLVAHYHAINPDIRARLAAGNYPVPIDVVTRQRFLREVLVFNRNAIAYLSAGILPDIEDDGLFHLTWLVPKCRQPLDKWTVDVMTFESLLNVASELVHRNLSSWTNSKH